MNKLSPRWIKTTMISKSLSSQKTFARVAFNPFQWVQHFVRLRQKLLWLLAKDQWRCRLKSFKNPLIWWKRVRENKNHRPNTTFFKLNSLKCPWHSIIQHISTSCKVNRNHSSKNLFSSRTAHQEIATGTLGKVKQEVNTKESFPNFIGEKAVPLFPTMGLTTAVN